jgi:cellulose synthase/poly-beta-1,6-N-acetylglucosamine synthase-like glycosyltransferase
VAVVIVAHNEEGRIGGRVANLLASRVEVAVCSDGSSDGTAQAARRAGARVFDFPARRGKAACLSEVIPALDAAIIVLADARQLFTPDTIPRLVRHFADPAIGAVSGILRVGDPATAAGAGVDLYWKMETAVRQAESDFDSCVGCTGAVYAIRRALFEPLPADTILDDVVIPMRIALRGYRVVYDSEAEAFDPQPLDPRAETRRKARTLAGNFQMLTRHPGWLLPWRNRLAFQLISHKYLRLAGPLLLVGALASSACLAGQPFYRACLGLQVLLYLLAAAGLALPSLRSYPFSIPAGFLFLNVMVLRGFFRFLAGPRGGAWDKGAAAHG